VAGATPMVLTMGAGAKIGAGATTGALNIGAEKTGAGRICGAGTSGPRPKP
jgi:hypothetical protein